MQDMETTNLCGTCRKMPECFKKGIFEREVCDEYESLSLKELAERDESDRAFMVGDCPRCSSKNTYDCDNPLEQISDPTVAHCTDCGIYWCLECGYVFESVKRGTQCPHWKICANCSDEHGYLEQDEFMKKICPICEYYDNGCQLEDPSECDKQHDLLCPHEYDISQCPQIEQFLQEEN